jgi:hypothetical protein
MAGRGAREKKTSATAMWCTRAIACIALVTAGLIAAVVMMTRGTSSIGTTLQNDGASSVLVKYITTMSDGSKGKHATSRGAMKVDDAYDSMDVGQHRRQRMEVYLSERAKCDHQGGQSSGWVLIDMGSNNITYNSEWTQDFGTGLKYSAFEPRDDVALTMCEVEDKGASSGWIFARFGPFIGRGGYDWHNAGIHHVPRNPKAKFITAKMFAPVAEDGRILGYPPIHAHHVHMNLDGVGHWFDSHGDSVCSEELGGTACYLREQPEGYGFPLLESDEYTLDFIVNDVRELGSPAMAFYMETSLRWSTD